MSVCIANLACLRLPGRDRGHCSVHTELHEGYPSTVVIQDVNAAKMRSI